jgi:hypothetical protein
MSRCLISYGICAKESLGKIPIGNNPTNQTAKDSILPISYANPWCSPNPLEYSSKKCTNTLMGSFCILGKNRGFAGITWEVY